ncbi:preprotein translocase subunit SecG [Pseudomonas sp. JAI115]|uniref:hypothetical protein n=1 Tax=Pseudomonas sp. JAI115 TaxID=2723061 RepID=UPI0017B9E283|nr:preprotein translocase subunit SecG [Pseudomonas sp. JAI115]
MRCRKSAASFSGSSAVINTGSSGIEAFLEQTSKALGTLKQRAVKSAQLIDQ